MMKWPYCNTEMIQGYLNCGMLIWSDKKHKLSLCVDDTERYARKLGKTMLSLHHVESDCCPKSWLKRYTFK